MQYLWHILRISALKASTIEKFYGMRSNPLLLVSPLVIMAAPVLAMTVVLGWVASIVIIYPPGALTVTARPISISRDIGLPIFDPGYIGNSSSYMSMQGAANNSLSKIILESESSEVEIGQFLINRHVLKLC